MKVLHLSLGLACVSACAETEESIGTLVHEDGPRGSWSSSLGSHVRAEALLGRDAAGQLALVRLADGEVVTRFHLGDLEGAPDASAFVRDDGSLSHLALLAHDEEEQAGLLRLVPSSPAGFARGVEVAKLEGRTRTLALAGGALVMQDDIGQRWSFARPSGGFQETTACPMPASIIASDSSESHASVLAFGWSDAEPVLIDARLGNGVWQCDRYPLSVKDPLSETARAALAPDVGRVIVDAKRSGLRIGLLADTEVGPFAVAELGAERVEQAEPWALGDQSGVVVLTSRPAAVTVLSLERQAGARLGIVAAATVLLPFVTESPCFSRELAVTEDRVFVATEMGLIGFELAAEPALGLHQVTVAPSLRALRGPLVPVPELPLSYAPIVGRDQSLDD